MINKAECACGKTTIEVEGSPSHVISCHCDYCQKRTGSVFQVCGWYPEKNVISKSGPTKTFANRLTFKVLTTNSVPTVAQPYIGHSMISLVWWLLLPVASWILNIQNPRWIFKFNTDITGCYQLRVSQAMKHSLIMKMKFLVMKTHKVFRMPDKVYFPKLGL